MIVVPGQGIPGVVTVDMSLREAQETVKDLQIRTYPPLGLPGQTDVFGERLRYPWETPWSYSAESPSLGLALSANKLDVPLQAMWFFIGGDNRMVGSNTWFTGQLSCGISFANRRRVRREEIIAHFGEPQVRLTNSSQAFLLAQSGVSLSEKNTNAVENLFYPALGISFSLKKEEVISFEVRKPAMGKLQAE